MWKQWRKPRTRQRETSTAVLQFVFVIEQRGIIVCSLTFHFSVYVSLAVWALATDQPSFDSMWIFKIYHHLPTVFVSNLTSCLPPNPLLYIRHISLKKALISHSPDFPTADGWNAALFQMHSVRSVYRSPLLINSDIKAPRNRKHPVCR